MAFSCTHPVSSHRLKAAGLWCFHLARAPLDLKMKRVKRECFHLSERWVFSACDGCLSEPPLAFNSYCARACAGVENTCAVSIFDNDCVCACACVGIWMCVWCVHVGIRVGVGFCSIPTLVI